jgi:hypothetical protein
VPCAARGVETLRCSGPAADSEDMTVEVIDDLLRATVAERQALRDNGARRESLERNRLRIVALQWALSRALVERFAAPERQAA